MICLAVTYLALPGLEADVADLLRELAEASRTEPGCRLYVPHRSPSDPRRFFLYEQYDDQAALDAHRASPHFARLGSGGIFPRLESRSPEIYEPLAD